MSTQLDYTVTLTQNNNGSIEPLNIGPYYLKKGPLFNTKTITGEFLGDGSWKFPNYSEGEYELWDETNKIEKWGRKFLGDLTPSYESLTINGNAVITGNLILGSNIATDCLFINGQVQVSSSMNFNSINDIARVRNIQINSISSTSGSNIDFKSMPIYSGVPSGSNALTNIQYSDSKYYPLSSSNATYVYTPTNFRNIVVFSSTTPPVCNVAPTNGTMLSNKQYVDSEISTRINAFTTGSYQESPNCIRLIPNGTPEPNKVYTNWASALSWGSGSATATNIKTVLLCGNGTANSNISMQTTTGSKYAIDYVNFKSVGVVTVGFDVNLPSGSFGTNTLGKIVFDSVNFFGDDFDLGNTGEIENVIFRNTKFYIKTSAFLSFIGCEFQNCYFDSFADNQFQFINCKGSPIHCEKLVTVTGTNKISVNYNDRFTVGSTTFFEENDLSDEDELETEPFEYLQINVNGVNGYIPMFLKA